MKMDRAATDLTRALTSIGIPSTVTTAEGSIVLSVAGGGSVRLFAVSAGGGWPSEVRALLAANERRPDWLLVAPRFSESSLRMLNEAGVNWVDGRGNVRIVAPPVVLIRSNSVETALRSEWSILQPGAPTPPFRWGGAAMDLAEELLSSRPDDISVTPLSEATGWSAGMVTRVLQTFEELEWVTAGGRGPKKRRRLTDPGPMLDAWSEAVAENPLPSVQAHALMRDPWRYLVDQLVPVLPPMRYGMTTWVAAEAVAPFASAIPIIDLYVPAQWLDNEWPRLASDPSSRLFARPVDDGANLCLRAADSRILARTREAGGPVRTASLPRVYADLLALGGRARDVAQHLRETALGI